MHSSGPKCKFRVITDVNSGVCGWYSGVFHDLKTPEYPLKTPQYPLLHLAAHLQYTPKHSSGPEYNIFSITDVNSGVCGGYSGLFQCYKEVSPPPSPQLPTPLPSPCWRQHYKGVHLSEHYPVCLHTSQPCPQCCIVC